MEHDLYLFMAVSDDLEKKNSQQFCSVAGVYC